MSRRGTLMVVAGAIALLAASAARAEAGALWPSAGYDLENSHYQRTEYRIGVANAPSLTELWQFTTGGDVSATPAVDLTTVYVPDWAGNLFALDRRTGAVIWSRQISEYTGQAKDFARTTPVLWGNLLIFGSQGGTPRDGARMMAVDRATGALVWITQVESHFAAFITTSAIVDPGSGIAYVGVASNEEALAAYIPDYQCCTFRGSTVALDAATGAILWKTYLAPSDPPGYSGVAVWSSTPVVDHSRHSLYVSTGNNYSMPESVEACVLAATDPESTKACISPDNHFDSIVALDLSTGAIKWATRAMSVDAWNLACWFGGANCPDPMGPDYDFGQGPMLIKAQAGSTRTRDLVGCGQKSGVFWALDADTGEVIWRTQAGPGGTAGGLIWGSATDGERIYVSNTNSGMAPWTLIQNGAPTTETVTSGVWSALDADTGAIVWQTADPLGAKDGGAVTLANRVLYACSLDPAGHMYAFDSSTGQVLWDFASGGSCNSGAAVSTGTVFWGSGYTRFGLGTPNNKFRAFSVR